MFRVSNISFVLLLVILAGNVFALEKFPRVEMPIKGKLYNIEIADTPARKAQGLMYRQSLKRNAGMLFYYQKAIGLKIWMKNTLIPLTVLWLNDRAEVIHVERLLPCRKDPCPVYGPEKPARYVLELHHDEWQRFSLGDRLVGVDELRQRWFAGQSPQ